LNEAVNALEKAVTDQGLSVEEYDSILEVAQSDPDVREKIRQRIRGDLLQLGYGIASSCQMTAVCAFILDRPPSDREAGIPFQRVANPQGNRALRSSPPIMVLAKQNRLSDG
jgi:hypothetical protein